MKVRCARNGLIKLCAILLLSLFIILLCGFSLSKIVMHARLAIVPPRLRGEYRVFQSLEIATSSSDVTYKDAVMSEDGNKAVLLVGSDADNKLLLWRRNIGLTTLEQVEQVKSFSISGNGKRVFYIASGVEQSSLFYMWEEGFGSEQLAGISFRDSWQISSSQNGRHVIAVPLQQKSVVMLRERTYRAPVILTIRRPKVSSSIAQHREHGIPDVHIDLLANVDNILHAATDNSGSVAIVSTERDTNAFKYKRFAKQRRIATNDVNSDGRSDYLTFSKGDSSSSYPVWRVHTSGSKYSDNKYAYGEFVWRVGDASGIPVPGDYNGDGLLDLATFTTRTDSHLLDKRAKWEIFYSSLKNGVISPEKRETVFWGFNDALPVPADYDGDGTTDIAVFLPSQAGWYLLLSSGGFNQAKAEQRHKGAGSIIKWGDTNSIPVPADYNGDGSDDIAVWTPPIAPDKLGIWKVLHLTISNGQVLQTYSGREYRIGYLGDIPVPGDFNCDGKADVTVFRPSNGTWVTRLANNKVQTVQFAPMEGSVPFFADFDGDGCADRALFHNAIPPVSWWMVKSSLLINNGKLGTIKLPWGGGGEAPPQILNRQFKSGAYCKGPNDLGTKSPGSPHCQ